MNATNAAHRPRTSQVDHHHQQLTSCSAADLGGLTDEDCDESVVSSSSLGCSNCCHGCVSCCCNCRQRDEDLREICRELDFHGIRKIITRNKNRESNSIRSTVWLVILLILFAAFIYMTTGCIFVFLSEPQMTVHSARYAFDLRLPHITICNLNPLSLIEMTKKWPISVDVGHVTWSSSSSSSDVGLSWNSVNVSSWDVFAQAGHKLNKMLLRCNAGPVPCNVSNFTKTLTEAGACYTVEPNASELRLLLNAEGYDYSRYNEEGIGIRLIIDSHVKEAAISMSSIVDSGFLLAPKQHSLINVRRTDVTLISSQLSPCSSLVKSIHPCIDACRADVIRNVCSCRPFWISPTDFRTKVCSMKQHLTCVTGQLQGMSSFRMRNCSCEVPCSTSEYRFDVSFSNLFRTQRTTIETTNFVEESRMKEMKEDQCKAANIRARTDRKTWLHDTEQIVEFSRALDDIAYQMEILQVNLGQVGQQLRGYIGGLQPRIAFHVYIGLIGVRKAFDEGFAGAYENVLERSLSPLMSGFYETVAHLERSVKQLLFTSTSETIQRKVVYFMSDNELSGKLELAIQSLDNLTKVYYSFLNAEPTSELDLTPEHRYDSNLIPYLILSETHEPLKSHYTAISENIAGLIEHILSLKGLLKDVYQRNIYNETAFDQSRTAFLYHMLQVRRFSDLFKTEVIKKSLDSIDSKINDLKHLNESLVGETRKMSQRFHTLQNLIDAAYSEPYSSVLRFSQEAQRYIKEANFQKSTIGQTTSEITIRSIRTLIKHIRDIQSYADEMETGWRTIMDLIKSVWKRLLSEESLRNFYMNVYNDVKDMVNHPQRLDVFKALFFHPKMLGAYLSTRAAAHGILGHTGSDFYALLNADVPVINYTIKSINVTLDVSRFAKETSIIEIFGGRDDRLESTFDALNANLVNFQSQCQLSQDLIRENVIEVVIRMADAVIKQRQEHPSNTFFTLLGQLGGLMALFLGASFISCLELIDLTFQGACGAMTRNRKSSSRKFPDSNHVLFKPIDMRDDVAMTTSNPTAIRSSSNRLPQSIAMTKVKVDATYRGKHSHSQAETNI